MSVAKGGWAASAELDGGASVGSAQQSYLHAHACVSELQQDLRGYEERVGRVLQHIAALSAAVGTLRQHYESVTDEHKTLADALEKAEFRMMEVQNLVERYNAVADPVVASDGFTYERETITKYLHDCQAAKNVPISQSKTELTTMLFPNRSLKRLLDLLKETKPPNMRTEPNPHAHTTNHPEGAPPAMGRHANGAVSQSVSQKSASLKEGGERLHPCVRVYGYCNYKDTCAYALYPYDACLSHLKGKCRFRSQCHEPHVDFRGPVGHNTSNGEVRSNHA